VVTIGISFTEMERVTTPKFIGLDNYATAMGDTAFWNLVPETTSP